MATTKIRQTPLVLGSSIPSEAVVLIIFIPELILGVASVCFERHGVNPRELRSPVLPGILLQSWLRNGCTKLLLFQHCFCCSAFKVTNVPSVPLISSTSGCHAVSLNALQLHSLLLLAADCLRLLFSRCGLSHGQSYYSNYLRCITTCPT